MDDALFSLFRSDVRKLDPLTQRNLFLSFRELVFRNVFFILNDRSLTEDAIQESFIKAMKNGPKTAYDSNMKAWLKRVSRNTAYDIIRKNKKYCHNYDSEIVLNYEDHDSFLIGEATDEIVESMLRSETLVEALNELKFEFRIVLVLRYIEDMSYKEISNELGISEQVMSKRLERAKKKLASIFLSKWGEQR